MKKKTLAPILMLMLPMSIIYGVHLAKVAEANFVPSGPFIVIDSPEENGTYTAGSVWLNLTLRAFYDSDSWNVSRVVKCSLDGEENTTIPVVYEGEDENDFHSIVTGLFLLPDLSDGSHSITVYATYDYLEPWNLFYSDTKTINFMVELPEPNPSPESLVQPFPTALVIVAIVVATAAVILGSFVYFKKLKPLTKMGYKRQVSGEQVSLHC